MAFMPMHKPTNHLDMNSMSKNDIYKSWPPGRENGNHAL